MATAQPPDGERDPARPALLPCLGPPPSSPGPQPSPLSPALPAPSAPGPEQ